jgi:hypothetical protein
VNHIGEVDPSTIIWRYQTFEKFTKLMELRAIWFAKLAKFEDVEEGMTPALARQALKSQHLEMETWFEDEERKSQVRRFVEHNEFSGRDLIVASCWFIGEDDCEDMWAGYAKDSEGVAIKSTVGALMRSLTQALKNKWWIGRIKYVDLSTHQMNAYDGSQAHLRAFLKGMKYSHEIELRVATMNWVVRGCLNPDGSPQTERQGMGLCDVSNGPGIYVQADHSTLIIEMRSAPGAGDAQRAKIELLMSKAGLRVPLGQSEIAR